MSEEYNKRDKMFGRKVILPRCPKCGKNAVAIEMAACLACDWKDLTSTLWNTAGTFEEPLSPAITKAMEIQAFGNQTVHGEDFAKKAAEETKK